MSQKKAHTPPHKKRFNKPFLSCVFSLKDNSSNRIPLAIKANISIIFNKILFDSFLFLFFLINSLIANKNTFLKTGELQIKWKEKTLVSNLNIILKS